MSSLGKSLHSFAFANALAMTKHERKYFKVSLKMENTNRFSYSSRSKWNPCPAEQFWFYKSTLSNFVWKWKTSHRKNHENSIKIHLAFQGKIFWIIQRWQTKCVSFTATNFEIYFHHMNRNVFIETNRSTMPWKFSTQLKANKHMMILLDARRENFNKLQFFISLLFVFSSTFMMIDDSS